VAGDALAAASQFTAPFKPSPQTVEDHYLVPKCAAEIDGGDVADAEILVGQIVSDEWSDGQWSVRIEGGFRTRFDFDALRM
jgi:hypothetical protein